MPDGDERETTPWGPIPPELAEDIPVKEGQAVYALPYYTREDGDTEILISNPGLAPVSGALHVFGEDCRVVGRKSIRRLGPNCTGSFRLRAIQPDFAGHVVMVVSAPVLAHVVYLRRDDLAIVGDSMTGVPELTGWLANERSRTYGFGYRAAPVRGSSAHAGGAVFVSNPNSTPLAVELVFYHQKCDEAGRERDEIRPGCTAEYAFPQGHYGYGRVQVSAPAVINVLHFAEERGGVAAAELLADGDRLAGGVPVRERHDRVLFDDTHGCRPGPTGAADYTKIEAELAAAGLTVSHLTGTLDLATLEQHDVFVIAMPTDYYTQAEKKAITDFVNRGGGLLIGQDFGLTPPLPSTMWTFQAREILYLFGAADDQNMAQDQQHNMGQPGSIEFENGRNFGPHPIVQPLKRFTVDAVCTLSGGHGWETVAETDDDTVPPRRPVMMARGFGAGRVLAYGDTNTFADYFIGTGQNAQLGVRCVEWLLFKL